MHLAEIEQWPPKPPFPPIWGLPPFGPCALTQSFKVIVRLGAPTAGRFGRPSSSHGGGGAWEFSFVGGSPLGVWSFGMCRCFAAPGEGGRGGWRGRRWQCTPAFCMRLGPAAPGAGGRDRSEGRGSRPPTGRPCWLRRAREPGDPGPAARPGGRGQQERGARSGRGCISGRGISPRAPRPASGPSRVREHKGSAEEWLQRPGGIPGRWVPGSC